MEENRIIENEEEGLSLLDLLQIIKRHIILIILFVGVCFSLMVVYSYKIQTPVYQSYATAMVNTSTSSSSSASTDYTYAQKIMSTYEVLIQSNIVLNEVSENIKDVTLDDKEYHLNYSATQLSSMVSTKVLTGTSSVTESLVVAVIVKSYVPEHCAIIANEIVSVTQSLSQTSSDYSILKNSTLSKVDAAEVNYNYDKNLVRNSVIGIGIGGILAVIYIVLREALDTTVSDVRFIETTYGLNVLSIVPDEESKQKTKSKEK